MWPMLDLEKFKFKFELNRFDFRKIRIAEHLIFRATTVLIFCEPQPQKVVFCMNQPNDHLLSVCQLADFGNMIHNQMDVVSGVVLSIQFQCYMFHKCTCLTVIFMVTYSNCIPFARNSVFFLFNGLRFCHIFF